MLLTIYAHSSKESNYEHARKAGIEGEALNRAMYLGYELTLEYEVDPLTGLGVLMMVDGQLLTPIEKAPPCSNDKANLSAGTPITRTLPPKPPVGPPKIFESCPADTNGDGDCGRRYCPYCGKEKMT